MSDLADLDDLSEERGPKRPGLPVDPGRVWLSLKRGWRWLPIGVAAGAVVGLIVAFVAIKHTFKSETILIWEPIGNPASQNRDLVTHAGVLKLPSTVGEVKKRLKSAVPLEALTASIEVWYDTSSSLVTVEAGGATPEEAQTLAKTVVEVFLEHQKKLGATRASEMVETISKDLETARVRLDKARAAYDAFRAEHGVSDFEAEATLAITKAAEIKAAREEAQADALALDARVSKLGTLVKSQRRTSVQSASSTNPAAARLAEARAELASLRARLAPEHPRIAALEAQVQSLEQQAAKKSNVVSNVTTTVDPEYASIRSTLSASEAAKAEAEERQRSYEEMAKGAAQRVAALSAIEGEARELKSDLELAEQRVAELEVELSQVRAAERSPTSEFRVLTPALLPEYPERSRRKLALIGLTLLGFMGALGFLIVRPIRDGRIYTAREAAFWSRFPVVGSTAWPARREMFFPFVDELNDHAALTRGTTLVIGAGSLELPLARELSYWLGPAPNKSTMGEAQRTNGSGRTTDPGPGSAVASDPPVHTRSTPVPSPVPPSSGGMAAQASASSAYPLVRVTSPGTALAHRNEMLPAFYAWSGELEGPSVRRAARMADRVLVLVQSGGQSVAQVATVGSRLGRDSGVGMLVVGVGDDLLNLPDRAGDVDAFWR